MCMNVWLHVYMHTTHLPGALWRPNPLELELQTLMAAVWVLGTESLGPLRAAAHALKC